MARKIAEDGIKWRFIPPGAPHFRGLWKAMKYHLKRVLVKSFVTFEELTTILTEKEAVMKSRPLCPITNDPTDFEIITPGHFLIGQAIIAAPEPNILNKNIDHLTRWQRIQHITQSFWKKWHQEYVTNLQQRTKWQFQNPNVTIGNKVLTRMIKCLHQSGCWEGFWRLMPVMME